MAERGPETLRYGPMKPVGLSNPHTPGVKPYAVVQLRQDNALGSLWNMVGFQTKLKHGEQVRVFRTIPGLEQAEFARLGGLHRNTFLNSPKLARRNAQAEGRSAASLRRADHRRRGLCRIRRRSGSSRAASPPPSGSADARAAAADHGARRAAQPHHRRASQRGWRGGGAQLPADERQFRTVPRRSPRRPTPRGKGPRSSKGFERKRALAARALADLETGSRGKSSVAAE